jgi:hypothetical protein
METLMTTSTLSLTKEEKLHNISTWKAFSQGRPERTASYHLLRTILSNKNVFIAFQPLKNPKKIDLWENPYNKLTGAINQLSTQLNQVTHHEASNQKTWSSNWQMRNKFETLLAESLNLPLKEVKGMADWQDISIPNPDKDKFWLTYRTETGIIDAPYLRYMSYKEHSDHYFLLSEIVVKEIHDKLTELTVEINKRNQEIIANVQQ